MGGPNTMDTAVPGLAQVWDLPTRLFHWLIVLLVAGAWLTQWLNWMDWHVLDGEALLALLLFRLGWGVAGSETSRFAAFLAGPRRAARHLAHLFQGEPESLVGHNPAGGWMVVLFLVLLLGQSLTGIVVNNDVADAGPLTPLMPAWVANTITGLHTWLWDALLAAIALHVAAIGFYAARGQNLLGPMVSGRKRLVTARPPYLAPLARAVPLLAAGIVVAVLLTSYL